MRERKLYTALAIVVTLIVLVGPGVLYSKPWVHRPSLNELAVKAGYTNVKTVETYSEHRSKATARLGECAMELDRYKYEIGDDKFTVKFLVYGLTSDKTVTLIGNRKELPKAEDALKVWMSKGQTRGWIDPRFCDARKPYHGS